MPGSTSGPGKNRFSQMEDKELHELAMIAGLTIDPAAFSLLVDLIRLDVDPSAIFAVLQAIAAQSKPPTQQKKPLPSKNQIATRKKPPTPVKPVNKAASLERHTS